MFYNMPESCDTARKKREEAGNLPDLWKSEIDEKSTKNGGSRYIGNANIWKNCY
jgi:hypothetical protein